MTAASCGAAQAETINYESISQEGFGDVAKLLQSMTPAQRDMLMKQVAQKEKDVQKLSPAQLEQLRTQLRAIAVNIDFNKIDPATLDMARAQRVAGTQKKMTQAVGMH